MVDVARRAYQLHLELLLSHPGAPPLVLPERVTSADRGLRFWDGTEHWQLCPLADGRYGRQRLQSKLPPTDN